MADNFFSVNLTECSTRFDEIYANRTEKNLLNPREKIDCLQNDKCY